MILAISTHWNAHHHSSGEALVEEILALGIRHLELGYDLTLDLVPGVRKMLAEKTVQVCSVHNFCPVPTGAPLGHPELFSLSSPDKRILDAAVRHTIQTVDFAREIGAQAVVIHAGHVDMPHYTQKLLTLCDKGKQFSPRYDRVKWRLIARREKAAPKHLDPFRQALDKILPMAQGGPRLAIENLPSWESLPSESEMFDLLAQYDTPSLGYWHDMGHAQIRDNLGFANHRHWFAKLHPRLAGLHVHDVRPPATDHLMPPKGNIDFPLFKTFIASDTVCVLEPAPGTPREDLAEGIRFVNTVWQTPATEGDSHGT